MNISAIYKLFGDPTIYSVNYKFDSLQAKKHEEVQPREVWIHKDAQTKEVYTTPIV